MLSPEIKIRNVNSIRKSSGLIADRIEIIKEFTYKLKRKNIVGYLLHILDPIDISFKVGDNVQINDLETNKSMLLGDSHFIKEKYKENLNKLISELKITPLVQTLSDSKSSLLVPTLPM